MIPVFQTTMDNCLAACIASLLEITIESIPDFNEDESSGFYDENGKAIATPENEGFEKYIARLNQEFFPDFNMSIMAIQFANENFCPLGFSVGVFTITSGSAKGFLHAMVCYEGRIIHDPRANTKRSYDRSNTYYIFTYLNPAQIKDEEDK